VAAGVLIVAAMMSPTHVEAVRVSATARSVLTTKDCSAGKTLLVSFSWHGGNMTQPDAAPDCARDHRPGDPITVYIASNDPSNIGPDANWILNPDTHDPFDFIAPNGLRGFIAMLSAIPLVAALVWYMAAYRTHRRAPRSNAH